MYWGLIDIGSHLCMWKIKITTTNAQLNNWKHINDLIIIILILSVPQTLPKGNSKCYSKENRFQMSMGMDQSVSTISTIYHTLKSCPVYQILITHINIYA